MARPAKNGLEYFQMDTDFFADKKIRLLRCEFGAAGMLVLLATYCRIYDTEGYWARKRRRNQGADWRGNAAAGDQRGAGVRME